MNHKPQSLTALPWLTVAGVFLLAAPVLALRMPAGFGDEVQPPAESAEPTAPESQATSATPQEVPVEQSGDELLTEVRTKLEGLDSLTCDLNQTALISGMKLLASGRYAEASGNRVHLEYQIYPLVSAGADDSKALALDTEAPTVDESTSRGVLTQVSDGNVLYTLWKNGDAIKVTRRNIRDILEAALAASNYDPKNAAMDLGIGGLRGLISRLQASMEFAPVKTIKIGEQDYLEVTGRWNQRVRTEVFQLPEGTITIPNEDIPEYVRVYVNAETMLPRRIQYLKRSLDAVQRHVRPMITLDLRNLVLNEQLDDQLFVFHAPENTLEEDLTEQVIQQIQQAGKPAGEGAPGSATDGVVPPKASVPSAATGDN